MRSGHEATAARSSVEDGQFADVLEERSPEWRLTSAERDVAMMTIKVFSISEIAALCKSSEGRVKAQTNAIYRKAGVSARWRPMSVFIDEWLTGQIGKRL